MTDKPTYEELEQRVRELEGAELKHQRTEEALRKLDVMLVKIASQVPGMLYQFVLNPDGYYSVPYCSNGIREIFGCSPEDVRNDFSPILNAIHPEDRNKILQTIDASAKNLSQWKCEYRVHLSGQPVKWMLGNSMPEGRPDGSIVWNGYNVDITDRIRSEEALHESEERLQLVMEGSQLGYWDWNIETGEVCRNTYWAEMIGYTLAKIEYTISQWTDLHHPDDAAAAWKSIQDHLDGKTPAHRIEYRMLAKDGHYKWILDQARVVKRDAYGKPKRMCGTHTDISERKQAEIEREKLQAQLAQAQKMEAVGRLAAGMAHEVNNPLAGILQNASVLKNRLLGDLPANHKAAETAGITLSAIRQYLELRKLPGMIENISESGNRAAAIVRNMLSFARKSDRCVSTHDLGALLDQTLELVQTDYDMKKHYDVKRIRIEREYDPLAPPVPCEASKIQQVFMNILKNGAEAMAEFKYNRDTPAFVLRVQNDGDWVRVEIEDNGPGIDEKTRRRIFEPFFTTKPTGKGTGLGLSVSYFIITEDHGGHMSVQAADSGGSCFVIQLPKAGRT